MAEDQVHAFLEKVKSDPGLQAKLKDIPQGPEGMSHVLGVASEAGFNFSEEDLAAATKSKSASGEVSQEDLDKIAGGTIIGTITIIVNVTMTVCRS